MKRIIEDLIEQRKKKKENLSNTINRLAGLFGKKSFFRSGKKPIQETLRQLSIDLDEWVTTQDREWDAYASNHATTVFKSLQWKIEKLESEYSLLRTLLTQFIHLERSLGDLITQIENQVDPGLLDRIKSVRDQISVLQYSGFEERFRGKAEDVRLRLQKYLAYFAPAKASILDLGCGRGEFLELLRDNGIPAFGIDISESMLNQAREKGLDCRKADALAALKEQPTASLGGIFSAQVIEHFPSPYLDSIVQESFRVLQSGALLIMETINPLSLFALSRIYFMDPSHQHPLHPEYMRYLLESCGYQDVKIDFSKEPDEEKLEAVSADQPTALAFNRNTDRLNRLLFSPSEFAVIGRKP